MYPGREQREDQRMRSDPKSGKTSMCKLVGGSDPRKEITKFPVLDNLI